MLRKTRVAALLAAAVLGLSACAGIGDAGQGDTGADGTGHNDADVAFAQGMIPHHQQAVEMAELAQERARSEEVRALAERIEAAQGPEIELMTGWLEQWGEEVPAGHGAGGMDHGGAMAGEDMSGMMSEQQMADLGSARGPAFDRMFLTMMIEHHEGAVAMARTEQAEGEFADAVELAERIEADQTAEIAQMKALLEG